MYRLRRQHSPNIAAKNDWEQAACTYRWAINAVFAVLAIAMVAYAIAAPNRYIGIAGIILLVVGIPRLRPDIRTWRQSANYRLAKRELLHQVQPYRGRDKLVLESPECVFIIETHQVGRISYLQILRADPADMVTSLRTGKPMPVMAFQVSGRMNVPVQRTGTFMTRSSGPDAHPGDLDIHATHMADMTLRQRDELFAKGAMFADTADLRILQLQLDAAVPNKSAPGAV
jgi:hypothetical protein